jgi:tryptophanyl-tRNA synthetase
MHTMTSEARPRVLSGIQPTADSFHLGNYLGAVRQWVAMQDDHDAFYFVPDLHALTVEHDPARIRALTYENAALALAAGLDPERTILYVQSHLAEHTELHYLLECATGYGEARRMIQFKEKASGQAHVRLSLLTYPVLMASDILLHDTEDVPVGQDQTQHVELTRDVATRFNARYGETFVVPRAVNPDVAARIMDLSNPAAKMSKSTVVPAGALFLLDPPDVLRRKVMRAVTDTETEVRHDPAAKPGVSNLLEILAACAAGASPGSLAGQFRGYGELKAAVADAVVAAVRPIQERYAALDPSYVDEVLRTGAERARERATATVRRAKRAVGLLPA